MQQQNVSTSLFVSQQDIETLTGFKTKARQIRWLRSEGIPFRVSGTGHPIVARATIEGRPAQEPPPATGWVPKVVRQT